MIEAERTAPAAQPTSDLLAELARQKIDHVFVVLLENHPFDKLYADFPGADGDRSQRHITKDRPWYMPIFEPTHGTPSWVMRKLWSYRMFRGKYGPADFPMWWQWARDYVLGDRHRTQRGPSTPNHVTLWAADSQGLNNNPKRFWLLRVAQSVLGHNGMDKEPPFDGLTVPNLLEQKGISWANYGDIDFNYFTQLADPKQPGRARNTFHTDQFFSDAATGKLPAVSWIFPEDAAQQSGLPGMQFTTKVMDAIKQAPGNVWERSAIFLTWDDWGGFYDHVQPVAGEAPEGWPQGGRVPMLVMSPYAKGGTVFHEPTIHPSVPRFIERLFGLSSINSVDQQANDFFHAFDFNQTPLPPPVTRMDKQQVAELERWVLANQPPKRSFLQRVHLRRAPVAAAPLERALG